MARPRAASRRIEPSDTPAKARPSHSPRRSLASTASRLFCASARISASASAAASSSRVLLLGLPDEPRVRMAESRERLSPALSSIDAAISSSSERTSASVSASSTRLTSGSIDASAPPASARAAQAVVRDDVVALSRQRRDLLARRSIERLACAYDEHAFAGGLQLAAGERGQYFGGPRVALGDQRADGLYPLVALAEGELL